MSSYAVGRGGLSHLSLALFAVFLCAAAPPPKHFEVVWSLEPSKQLASVTLIDQPVEVVKSRLLPSKLIVLDEDAVSETRGLIMVRDSELGLANLDTGGIAACIINPMSTLQRTGRKARANDINTCLVDEDGDHRFDHFFAYNSSMIPVGATGSVRGYEPIRPASYRQIDPTTSRDARAVALRASRQSHRTRVQLCVWPFLQGWRPSLGGKDAGCFEPPVLVPDEVLPSQFEFAGGVFELSRISDDGIRIEQRKVLGGQPLHIVKTPIW